MHVSYSQLMSIRLDTPIKLASQFSFIRQWASNVTNYSSAWGAVTDDGKYYSTYMALGIPDCYPAYGDCETAWCPLNSNNPEFLELKVRVFTI